MWGSSVFNTRIERLWLEVGKRFARAWRAFFLRLERKHFLNRKSHEHRWILHYLFLEDINIDCDRFMSEWNAHPISGAGGNYSPNDLAFMGELEHGFYVDECAGLDDHAINNFYGFDDSGEPLAMDSNGSEDSDDSSDGYTSEAEPDDEGVFNDDDYCTEETVDGNIRHDPVPVPGGRCPFDDSQLSLFKKGLQLLREHEDVPSGYGISPEEWGSEGYPTTEGHRQSYPIPLPDAIWRPRAQDWTRALYLMNQILN
ncbi:hypothetical protein CPC08DRAFT_651029 [Agrocybe pediades]|nr:hypothetical protein CPC08DRAFT_651029 [Agrocybe pediades]